jgi:integrase
LSRDDFIERSFNKSKSWGSKNVVEGSLKKFDAFCLDIYHKQSSELLQELRMSTGDELYHFLQDFINYMDKQGLKPKSIRTYFGFIKSYLRSQGIKTYHDDLKDLVRFPENIKEIPAPLTKENIRILLDGSKPDRKALYLTLISSGMRIGEALSLRKKNFDFTKDPVKITIPGKFTKTKQTRETYVSREAKMKY